MVDANGDSVMDVAGLSAVPGSETWMLRVVDGVDGRSIWSGQRYAPSARLACGSPSVFGIDDVDFQLHVFPARHPDAAFAIRLDDHIDKVGVGQNCLLVQTSHGPETAVAFTGAHIDGCADAALGERGGDVHVTTRDTLHASWDSTNYELSTRHPGTPFLLVSASSAGRLLWTNGLRYVRADAGLGMVATPNMLVVFGGDPRDDHYGVVIGIDPATGAERYAERQDSKWSGFPMQSMHFNGRYVIITWGYGLHAYDPSNGHRVWHVGGR
jgi:hypothetical protein